MRANLGAAIRRSLLPALLALGLPALGAPPAKIGTLLTQESFKSVTLPRSLQNDNIRYAMDYTDEEPVRVVDLDLNGDGVAERLIVGSERKCNKDGCPFALLDGKSTRDIGQFFGRLVVLDRRENGWSVIQTLGRNEEGLSNLTTYVFNRAQYQPEDSALIDEVAQNALLRALDPHR